jgi:hypothetical protein
MNMPTVQNPVQLTVEHLLSAVKQLPPDEFREFTRQLAEWQKQPRRREKSSETSEQSSRVALNPDSIGVTLEPERQLETKEEAVLIKVTKERLPAPDEKRLKQLCQKSERGTLTETDLEEYRGLAQQAEVLDFRRTKALAELVKLKGKSVYAVMKEIGWEGSEDE